MPSASQVVVVLGTGGTIAGTAAQASDHVGYTAGALSAQALIAAVPGLGGGAVEAESVAQLDSCDMSHATWVALRLAVQQHLARPEVCGVVVTHGTDTLEETAYFLHRTVAAHKPVVLTAAMRPATALSADGPQNLFDAVAVARLPGAQGVLAALNGKVYAGADLRKVHGYVVEAFSAGDAGPLAVVQGGALRSFRPWPQPVLHAAASRLPPAPNWPVVDIVTSHAGARGAVIAALVAAGAQGLVIAGTGNGSVHHALKAAAQAAVAAGVTVRRASRCQMGGVVAGENDSENDSEGDGEEAGSLPDAGVLTAPQARIELMLDLMLR
jgi:L-asparaginase